MKILILGGTGAIGSPLVQMLSERNNEIYITSRSKRVSYKNIHYIEGNAHLSEFVDLLLENHWDVIIDFMVYSTSCFQEVVIKYLEGADQYVFLSSARVYSNSNGPINESSARLLDVSTDNEFLDTDEYSLTKARQEDILRKTKKNNWTIIRPYITYNENRLQLGLLEKEEWLYRALKGRTIIFSDNINSKITTLTYGVDVAKGIVALIGNKNAYGEIFNITTKNNLKWENILNIYLNILKEHLGYTPKVVLLNNVDFLFCKPAKYQLIYDRAYDRSFEINKISNYINIDDFTTVEIGLRKCLLNFLENPQFNEINWLSEAKKDKISNEFTPLNEISGFKQKLKYLICRFNLVKI